MKKILVPIDFSADSINALEHAIWFANKVDSEIRMIHVKKSKNFEMPFYFKDFDLMLGKSLDDFFKVLIDRYKDQIKNKFDYKVREGKVYREIVNQAKYDDAYMIVMGTHGVSGFEEKWIGSNAYKVVSNSPCPIITIRNGFQPKDLKNIVLPIDATADTRKKVPFATELALLTGATIHVISATETGNNAVTEKVEKYRDQVEDYIKEKGGKTVVDSVIGSNITEITLEYAKKVDADLIVIMTEQSTNPINYIWLGAYAQQMVNNSPIPVMSINP